MSNLFKNFDQQLTDEVVSDILPSKYRAKETNKFNVQDRFTQYIFKELGWLENLDFNDTTTFEFGSDVFKNIESLNKISESIKSFENLFQESFTSKGEDILTKSQIQFSGFFTEQLKQRIGVELPKTPKQQSQIQDVAKNLKEDLNPLNLTTAFNIDFLSEISSLNKTSDNPNEKSDSELKKNEIESNVNFVLSKIWIINNDLLNHVENHLETFELFNNLSIQNNKKGVGELKKNLDELRIIFESPVIIDYRNGNDLHSQIISIKDHLYSIVDLSRKVSYEEQFQNDDYDSFISILKEINGDISNLITTQKKMLMSVLLDYKSLSPTNIDYPNVSTLDYQINELSVLEDDSFERIFERFYVNARDSYKISGASSVNKNATTFIDTTKTRRDVIADTDERVPVNHTIATPYVGVGEKLMDNESIETLERRKDCIGPIMGDAYKSLQECVSEGGYSQRGALGHLGRYLFSAQQLIEHGYVKVGTSTRNLVQKTNWLGKNDISSVVDLLSNSDEQDKIFQLIASLILRKLLNQNILAQGDPINEQAAAIATSYKFGLNTFKKLEKGEPVQDGNKNDAKEFYQKVVETIPSDIPQNEVTESVAKIDGTTESDQIAALSGSTMIPDTPTMYMPISGGATVYPLNKVTETESGHFTEFDDSPGAERIQERHRTGSGYEVLPDGSRKVVIVGESYVAVLSDHNIMVSGSVNISCNSNVNINAKGDVNINASNDLNFVVGGDINYDVGGNKNENVGGNSSSSVEGNNSQNISGFNSITAEGDMQFEAASILGLARSDSINFKSPEHFKVDTKNYTVFSNDKITMTSSNNIGFYTDQMSLIAPDKLDVRSNTVGFDTLQFNVDAVFTIDLKASDPVNCEVVRAQYSEESEKAIEAKELSTFIPDPKTPNPSSVSISLSEYELLSSIANNSDFTKNIQEFEGIDTTISQSHTNNASSNGSYFVGTSPI